MSNASSSMKHPTLQDGTFKQAYKIGPLASITQIGLGEIRVLKSRTLESLFDEIMDSVQCLPINQAIETALKPVFEASNIYFWVYEEDRNVIFSPTLNKQIPVEGNTIANAILRNEILITDDQSTHYSFNEEIDADPIDAKAPVLFIPVQRKSGSVRAVIQIAKQNNYPFFDQDIGIANYLVEKFRIYSNYIFSDKNFYTEAMQLVSHKDLPETLSTITSRLCQYFKAKKIEFWEKKNNQFMMYSQENQEASHFKESHIGIVSSCINDFIVINERINKNNRHYNEVIDGPSDDPSLFVPYRSETEDNVIWAIALRGRVSPPYYTKSDEAALLAFAPFAIKSIEANFSYFGSYQYQSLEERLTALLDVAETLTGVLDIDKLIPMIMARACNLLGAERCSLFIIDKTTQQLISHFHGGLKEAIKIPLNRGIVGYTATTGQVVIIDDAYSDSRFDRTVDMSTGFKTQSILTVPIFNNRGEITGVTEMINKANKKVFDENDVRMMTAFNIFCGTSLDNAKLYRASLDLTRQLRTFMKMSNALNSQSGLETVLQGILENARSTVSASNAILFSYDSNDTSLLRIASIGEITENPIDTSYAQQCVNSREAKLFTKVLTIQSNDPESVVENILAQTATKNEFGRSKLNKKNVSSRVSTLLTSTTNQQFINPTRTNLTICCIPLMNSEQAILGVMQLSCQWKIVSEDMKLLDSFAVFAAVSLERSKLKEIATMGKTEIELKQWILPSERNLTDKIPTRFYLPKAVLNQFWSIYFDAPAWDGIGHIRVIFNIFYKFKLLQEFNITNEKFFRFLSEMRNTYKKVPYHNWRHAVDVTQFITYQLLISRFDKNLTKFEIFGLLVSAVCHDANHDGFTNVYNVKAETPLGILFKNQSVMETHHCQIANEVITKEENNIFAIFSPEEYKRMWNLVFSLILATDMAKHFTIIKEFTTLKEDNTFSMKNPEHRLLLLQIILKCADISNVSRPFKLADKWCDVLCEEFFRQGDLEKANGMEFTSPNNDREHLDKPKSQIGFYTFVCLPLFQTAAKAIPALQVNVEQVEANLAIWKAANEEKPPS